MSEILLINPRRRKKRAAPKKRKKATSRRSGGVKRRATPKRRPARRAAAPKRKAPAMAKRKTRRKSTYRKNPSKSRSYARRAGKSARSTFAGLNFKSAMKNSPLFLIGMFGSKWMAKRFGGGASETDPGSWNYRSYLQGGLGAVATAFAMQMVKPGSGQKVLEGGMNLMLYEIIQNELIQPNEWAQNQFGDMGYGEMGEGGYEPGDVEQDEYGRTYLLGDNGQWRELPDAGVSGALAPVGPLGEALDPVGPLGQLAPVGPLGDDPYANAFLS